MAITLSSLGAIKQLPFDEIIDVRSPAEFTEDHIPGAINLPVLSNAERAQVGTIYTQVNPFEARKIGAALVAQNAARHMQETLADRPRGYRPLVYCWRGGQRSGAFALILKQVGWQADTVEGGYQSYRRLVSRALYDTPWPCPVVVLDGNTGTAKTEILQQAEMNDVQIIDLEGLANHRGSVFGARAGGQPSQKAFESALCSLCAELDPTRPVLVEAESSKVGQINLPTALWSAMKTAPRITLSADLNARAAYLARAYEDIAHDLPQLEHLINALAPRHPAERIADWKIQARDGALTELAQGLMQHHYDPRYARQRSRYTDKTRHHLALASLSCADISKAAQDVARLMKDLSAG